jgi:hypothetical protein
MGILLCMTSNLNWGQIYVHDSYLFLGEENYHKTMLKLTIAMCQLIQQALLNKFTGNYVLRTIEIWSLLQKRQTNNVDYNDLLKTNPETNRIVHTRI